MQTSVLFAVTVGRGHSHNSYTDLGEWGCDIVETKVLADWQHLVTQIREQIAQLAAEKIGQLIVFSGNRRGQNPTEGIASCITALKHVAPDAEAAGVVLTLEVFNTFDHADYDADHSDYAFEVAQAVSSPAVKVLYDLYHMYRMGEDVAGKVIANLEYVAHLHIAGSPKRDFPGDQQSMDYRDIVRRIHRAGYRGAWGMEFLLDADTQANEALDRAARLFRSYLI